MRIEQPPGHIVSHETVLLYLTAFLDRYENRVVL